MKDISLHLMDIAQNSIAAGADRIIIGIRTRGQPAKLVFEIIDNGKGMDADFLKEAADPFKTSRTTRDVGLGIPLLKQSAELTGGQLILSSEPFKGTKLEVIFVVDHINRIPLGDIPETFKMLVMATPDISWMILFSSDSNSFEIDTEEIKKQLGDVPIYDTNVLKWIQNTVAEGLKVVFGGVLDEVS
jgi:hypothetical protein